MGAQHTSTTIRDRLAARALEPARRRCDTMLVLVSVLESVAVESRPSRERELKCFRSQFPIEDVEDAKRSDGPLNSDTFILPIDINDLKNRPKHTEELKSRAAHSITAMKNDREDATSAVFNKPACSKSLRLLMQVSVEIGISCRGRRLPANQSKPFTVLLTQLAVNRSGRGTKR
ncbi:hypothetical protein B0H14DRAFT_2628430 [Mycena olivaceomarginata]|nr:hypothetical protein B0H14DRAFT_2628430 [Mycena olivaceomarginata]